MSVQVIHGDCLVEMQRLYDEGVRVDSVVTDPPYHLTSIVKRFGGKNAAPAQFGKDGAFARASKGFMGATWDGGMVAFEPKTWELVHNVMKPGAYLLAFASTRGYHRMVCAIEDAGFIIHPMLGWVFAQGMPKATRFKQEELSGWRYGVQSLKPALEPICMAQKPMEGTGSNNWAKHGVGGVNIDACRVDLADGEEQSERMDEASQDERYTLSGSTNFAAKPGRRIGSPAWGGPMKRLSAAPGQEGRLVPRAPPVPGGRWPANLIHDGSDEATAGFPQSDGQQGPIRGTEPSATGDRGIYGHFDRVPFGDRGDTGSAARFFTACPFDDVERFHYSGKADADDRAGSSHATIKPLSLASWLVKLITPPGGTVLDCFAGSGTTLEAAKRAGFNAIGIEREARYVADIHRRMGRASGDDTPLFSWTREGE